MVRIDEVIGRLCSAAGPDFGVAVRAQGVVFLRLGLALIGLVRFTQRRRGRTTSAHLCVPVAIRLQSDGIDSLNDGRTDFMIDRIWQLSRTETSLQTEENSVATGE